MAAKTIHFPYQWDARTGQMMPLLPVGLSAASTHVQVYALVDTGSPVNVLPRGIGDRLGLAWHQAEHLGVSGGALSGLEMRAALLKAHIQSLDTVTLAFAWAGNDLPPVILGQYDFLQRFRACFSAAEMAFDLRPQTAIRKP